MSNTDISLDELSNILADLFLSNMEESGDELVIRIRNAVYDLLRADQLSLLRDNPQKLKLEIRNNLRKLLQTDAAFRRSVIASHSGNVESFGNNLSVFISYRRSNSQDFVRLLADRFNRSKGVIARFDQTALRAGNFPIQLGRLVRQCDVFLLIVQPESLAGINDADNWIRREILTAVKAGKAIIPVLVDADGELDNLVWPNEIRTVGELQAVAFKREFFDVSAKRLLQEMWSLSKRTRYSRNKPR